MKEIHDILVEEIRKVKETFSNQKEINEETNLVTDLNFNSIDFMQLVVGIENKLDISFDLDEYMESEDINLYKSVIDYVSKKVSEGVEDDVTRAKIG